MKVKGGPEQIEHFRKEHEFGKKAAWGVKGERIAKKFYERIWKTELIKNPENQKKEGIFFRVMLGGLVTTYVRRNFDKDWESGRKTGEKVSDDPTFNQSPKGTNFRAASV